VGCFDGAELSFCFAVLSNGKSHSWSREAMGDAETYSAHIVRDVGEAARSTCIGVLAA
jgi:hypothetical protein